VNYNSGILVDTNSQLTRLKYFLEHIYSGGTPNTENSEYWTTDPHSGYAWVSIGDMSGTDLVSITYKRITEEGRLSKNLEILPAGTLIYSMYASMGHVALLKIPATINQALLGLKFNINIDTRYAKWWLTYLRDYVAAEASSNTQNNLNAEKVKNLPFPVIKLKTQKKIADYLDRETARIDALIEAKEKMLALLEEKRQALISRAVTKGLDPDVEMKDSGIEWLGKIPAHWKIIQLKYLINELIQGTSPVASNIPATENEYGVLKISSVSKGNFLPFENKALYDLPDNLHLYTIAKDDVLMTRGNTPKLVGDACYVDQNYPNLIVPDLIYRIRTEKSKLHSKFLTYFIISNSGRMQIDQSAKGSNESMIKLSQNEILNWLIVVPSLIEQNEIVNYINTFTEKSLQLSKEIEKSIALLKERKAALISSAVTGNIVVNEENQESKI